MGCFVGVVVCLWLLWCVCVAGGHASSTNADTHNRNTKHVGVVTELNDRSFGNFVHKHDVVLVHFYTTWCEHCKEMDPDFLKTARSFASQPQIALARVNGEKFIGLTQALEVDGYPTLKLMVNANDCGEYTGQRTLAAMKEFISAHINKGGLLFLKSSGDVLRYITAGRFVVVAFFDGCHSEMVNTFVEIADKLRKSGIYSSILCDAAQFGSLSARDGTVQLYAESGRKRSMFQVQSADHMTTALPVWVRLHTLPLFGEMGPQTFKMYSNAEVPVLLVFCWKTNNKFKDLVSNIAKQIRERGVAVAYVDGDVFGGYVDELGIDFEAGELPVAIVDYNNECHYSFGTHREHASSDVLQFVDEFAQGKLQPFLKSEPIPSADAAPEGVVVRVVGHTFDSMYQHEGPFVVLLHAPWCAVCVPARDMFGKLSSMVPEKNRIAFFEMDIGQNDIPVQHKQAFRTSALPAFRLVHAMTDATSTERRVDDFDSDLLSLSSVWEWIWKLVGEAPHPVPDGLDVVVAEGGDWRQGAGSEMDDNWWMMDPDDTTDNEQPMQVGVDFDGQQTHNAPEAFDRDADEMILESVLNKRPKGNMRFN